ncbi:MAG: hypothetical protein U0892_13890 [Pirellulales bacterium]
MYKMSTQRRSPITAITACTRLLSRLVIAICCLCLLGSIAGNVRAGCKLPHEELAGIASSSLEHSGPAGVIRLKGQWIYEGGQFKFILGRLVQDCDGPTCSSDKDRRQENVGLTPRLQLRVHFTPIDHCDFNERDSLIIVGRVHISDAMPVSGYPSAHEYPP